LQKNKINSITKDKKTQKKLKVKVKGKIKKTLQKNKINKLKKNNKKFNLKINYGLKHTKFKRFPNILNILKFFQLWVMIKNFIRITWWDKKSFKLLKVCYFYSTKNMFLETTKFFIVLWKIYYFDILMSRFVPSLAYLSIEFLIIKEILLNILIFITLKKYFGTLYYFQSASLQFILLLNHW
jgi:hypothetical protein